MTYIKLGVCLLLVYTLNNNKDYWYPLISWWVDYIAITCVAWFFSRRITRDLLCKKLIPRVNPHGKAVLITGCASGFGKMTAIDLNRRGFFVFAGCRDAKSAGAEELRKLASFPSRMVVLQLDVTKPEEIKKAYETVKETISTPVLGARELFALINNAGVTGSSEIEWGNPDSIELYEKLVDINTFGTIRMTKKFLPLIRECKGRVINITSVAGRINAVGLNPYSLSKAAQSRFTEAIQEELAPFGVKAVEIAPWFYKTKMLDVQFSLDSAIKNYNESTEEVKRTYNSFYKSIRRLIIFILSDPRVVIDDVQEVVDVIVDALTSAEPDAYYRVISPGYRSLVWILNDMLPSELVIGIRRLVGWGMKRLKVDSSKYRMDTNQKDANQTDANQNYAK